MAVGVTDKGGKGLGFVPIHRFTEMLPHGQELISSSVHLLSHLWLGIAASHLQIDSRRGPAQ